MIETAPTRAGLGAAALAAAFAAAPACADDLSANIGVASNYVWRGATQTDDGAAVSGGIDWTPPCGFYLGTWVSNVDFGGPEGGQVEWDLYSGYTGAVGDFGYDAGVIYYAYPDSSDADFTELALSGSFQFVTIGVNYTVDGQADDPAPFTRGDVYYYARLSFDLMQSWSLGLTVGHYAFDDDGRSDGTGGRLRLDYSHARLDLSKNAGAFGAVTFSVSKAGKEANGGDDDVKVLVAWNKAF